ncbi:hypothetical protein Hokovirus_1_22 [Hokovirus HKV1]|uniref:Uncharacterized protein n=1 Tax=Hokovirus HKV1 TaxID=1977638 RepID=A0A1V0SEK1_9VIRU|nr:hypothetical protein Hokovirus_1_22 [Hokovirus HKV1]
METNFVKYDFLNTIIYISKNHVSEVKRWLCLFGSCDNRNLYTFVCNKLNDGTEISIYKDTEPFQNNIDIIKINFDKVDFPDFKKEGEWLFRLTRDKNYMENNKKYLIKPKGFIFSLPDQMSEILIMHILSTMTDLLLDKHLCKYIINNYKKSIKLINKDNIEYYEC